MSKSSNDDKPRPGLLKTGDGFEVTGRGDMIPVTIIMKEGESIESLIAIQTQPEPSDDRVRASIVRHALWLVFVIVILGTSALLTLAVLDKSPSSMQAFLTIIFAGATDILAFSLGYYFGHARTKGRRSKPVIPSSAQQTG